MKYIYIFALLLVCLSINAETLKGKIVKVSDGDTATLLDKNNMQYIIRLHGIDAPESGQEYGNRAKQHLSGLIAGKQVSVDVKGMDMYKRVLGVIYLGEVNINAKMVEDGFAWNYKYSKDKYYIKLQNQAKENKRGLWQGNKPIDPWQFRKNKNKKKK